MARRSTPKVEVVRVDDAHGAPSRRRGWDRVAAEEPLELRLVVGGARRLAAVTMRTPGNDVELAAGFLFSEGIVRGRDDIVRIAYCTEVDEAQRYNVLNVELAPERGDPERLERLERSFVTTSACGVCGRAQLDDLAARGLEPLLPGDGPRVAPALVASLPERLRRAQAMFEATGGLHAAGLFGLDGEPLVVREDVGRHNALDKAIGWALLGDRLPLEAALLCLSGRASFELLQKAASARVPLVASVSAPSSLAVATARRFGLTLAGFVRDGRFTVYAGAERIAAQPLAADRYS